VLLYNLMQLASSNKSKKPLIFLAVLVGVGVAGFLIFKMYKSKGSIFGASQLSVNATEEKVEVFLDDAKVGETPYDSKEVRPGEHSLKLKGATSSYETVIPFSSASQVVINRDLGVSRTFASGQNFWLDSKDLSSKISIVSEPSQSKVFIDDAEVGVTPFSSSVLSDGEYDLRIEKEGYEPQSARAKVQKDFKLNVSVQLFLRPFPEKLETFPGSKMVYNLSSDNTELTLDAKPWASAVVYFANSRGSSTKFAYLLDYSGAIYNSEGKEINKDTEEGKSITLKAGDSVAYLGKKSDNGLSKEATDALPRFVGLDLGGKKVKVINTGIGFLRVRSEPSVNGQELGRLNEGDEVVTLEEKGGWYKISFEGKEGWISGSYVEEVKAETMPS